jgi:tRNA (guanine37-N1)-methyltransferase
LEAAGTPLNQKLVKKLSAQDQLIFICGRYEGVDARVYKLVDEKISLGPYVLAGGEIATGVIIEAVTRLLPGAIGKKESLAEESHNEEGFLEYPQYTRPDTFYPEPKNKRKTWKVPEILLSGDHKKITAWRKKESEKR